MGPAEILGTMAALHVLEPGDIVISAVHGHRGCSAVGDQFCGMLRNKGAAGVDAMSVDELKPYLQIH